MSWIYGYHLKWKVARDFAIKHKLVARAPGLVSLQVAKFIIRTTGLKTWISWASNGRTILTFHRCNERRSLKGMPISKEDILKVALALGMKRGPRWYAYSEFDRGDEVDSSDGGDMNWDTPATIEYPYLRVGIYRDGVYDSVELRDSDEDEDDEDEGEGSESDSEVDAETETDRTATI